MSNPINPHVLAAEKRASQFLIPAHEGEAERAEALTRASALLLQAAAELFRAGREDLVAHVHRVHQLAEVPRA